MSSLFGFVFNFNLIILLSLSLVTSNHFYQKSYAHDFLVNNDITIVTLVEQIKAETELVNTNFLFNNNVSAQVHARNAAELLNDLEDNMTEASEQSSSNLIQIYENEKTNTTSLALVTANIVDEVLRKYGTAFDIGYDLTNMSNMGGMKMSNMSSGGGTSMNMTTFQTSANNNTLERHSNMSMPTMTGINSKIVSIQDYETSQVLADVVNELFEDDLRPRTSVSETINSDKLGKNLKQLDQAILNKASPEALMGIVHVQIHPTLQQAYELELLGNVIAEDSD
ncbi:MAG: hypothetical protein M3146_02945 [Thermoproteota archaeon]|nr:hypothetical protein [Thermoproteota archaeon]